MLIKQFQPLCAEAQELLLWGASQGVESCKLIFDSAGESGYTLEQFIYAKNNAGRGQAFFDPIDYNELLARLGRGANPPSSPVLPQISLYDGVNVTPSQDYPKPERLVNGNPLRTTWAHYENDAQGLYTGLWGSEIGSWRFSQPSNQTESFYLISGRIRLHDDRGQVTEIQAGQSAVIPPGFTGIFEVVEPVTKQYTIVIQATTK